MRVRSVMLAAGETSGDQHAAHVARALRARDPSLKLYGMGSASMRAAGVDILVDSAPLAVVGLSEVIAHYPALRRALDSLKRVLAEQRPDLLILTDNPDFNLRLADTAHALGIPVLYYISPQVWAWRQGRVKRIAQCVNRMAVAFPFEVDFYRNAGVDVRFVGHPLLDEMPERTPAAQARAALGLAEDRPVVGLFPGSRRKEIERLAPILGAVARHVRQAMPEAQFLLPVAPGRDPSAILSGLGDVADAVKLDDSRDIYRCISACDAIAACSGTVTLQVALMGVPMAIFYSVSKLTYAIGRRLIRVPHIGLPNIVAGRKVVQEFVQQDATGNLIGGEILRLLGDRDYASRVSADLRGLREKLGSGGAAGRVAEMALEMMRA